MFSHFFLGDFLRKGYFSLKISDQQFFSEPQLISIEAFSTQVIKVPNSAQVDIPPLVLEDNASVPETLTQMMELVFP